MFGEGRGTVLLINAKPICWGVGEDLDDAMKKTAFRAIFILRLRHQAAARGDRMEKRREKWEKKWSGSTTDGSKPKGLEIYDDTIPTLSANETTVTTEGPSKKRRKLDISELLADDGPAITKLPNLTIYLPTATKKQRNPNGLQKNPIIILLESCFRNNITVKIEKLISLNKPKPNKPKRFEAELVIEDKTSDISFVSFGVGNDRKSARNDAANKAVQVLRKSQPCMYNKQEHMFLGPGQCVPK